MKHVVICYGFHLKSVTIFYRVHIRHVAVDYCFTSNRTRGNRLWVYLRIMTLSWPSFNTCGNILWASYKTCGNML